MKQRLRKRIFAQKAILYEKSPENRTFCAKPLIDILQAARKARAFAADLTYPQFQQSDLHQNAILKVLEIVGEAASRITTDTHRAYPQIPWCQIIGLRNRVVHGYFDVDLNLIWQIVHRDVPILIDQLQDLLPPDAD